MTLNIIKDKETKIHEIEGTYKIQKKLVSFTTNVLKAEIKDCTKIAARNCKNNGFKIAFFIKTTYRKKLNASKVKAKALSGVANLVCASLINSLSL